MTSSTTVDLLPPPGMKWWPGRGGDTWSSVLSGQHGSADVGGGGAGQLPRPGSMHPGLQAKASFSPPRPQQLNNSNASSARSMSGQGNNSDPGTTKKPKLKLPPVSFTVDVSCLDLLQRGALITLYLSVCYAGGG